MKTFGKIVARVVSGDRKKKAEKMNTSIYAQLLSRAATRVASARSEYTIYIRPQKRVYGRVITDDCEDKKKRTRGETTVNFKEIRVYDQFITKYNSVE